MYLRCLPSIEDFSHLLLTVYVDRGPHENFPEEYSADCVSVGSRKIPFAVRVIPSNNKSSPDSEDVLVYEEDDKGDVENKLLNERMPYII